MELSTINIDTWKEYPIQSLFDIGEMDDILDGECVIDAIQFCGQYLYNKNINKNEIIDYFGNKIIRDEQGNIKGIRLNTEDWNEAWNHWFKASYPAGEYDLISNINRGKIACCRLGFNRTHAVVLVRVDEKNRKFTYYDPVLNTINEVDAINIYDPRIIEAKPF